MRILKRLFAHVRPYWKPLLLTAIALLLETGLSLLPPLFQRAIIDGVLVTGDLNQLWKLTAGLVGVYALLQVVSAADCTASSTSGSWNWPSARRISAALLSAPAHETFRSSQRRYKLKTDYKSLMRRLLEPISALNSKFTKRRTCVDFCSPD